VTGFVNDAGRRVEPVMTMTRSALKLEISSHAVDEVAESRRQFESYCQSLADAGAARWYVNYEGGTELQLRTGEAYLFGDFGITRCW
jgi:uncharacterized protein YbcV (DUF1398 family)